MPLSARQERELRVTLLATRIIGIALCYAGPASYALVYALAVLQGRWTLYFQGIGAVPWQHPEVLAALAVAGSTLAGVFTLPGSLAKTRSQGRPPLMQARNRAILGFALAEAVAICGLVLGFVLGPSAASLTLVLLLIPPILGPWLLPREAQWRRLGADESRGGHA
jgi:hypothetical protein